MPDEHDIANDEVQTVNVLPPQTGVRKQPVPTGSPRPSGSSERPKPSLAGGSTEYTVATLRHEEVRTARTMIWVGRVIGVAALLPLPVLDGNTSAAIVFAATTLFAIAVGVFVELRIRDPRRISERMMVLLAASVVPSGIAALIYWGIFSGAQLFPVLAIYFFSRRERFSSAFVIYAVTAGLQLVAAVVFITNVVPDPGLYDPDLPVLDDVIGHTLIQVGDLAAFVLGWYSHRATQSAIEDMQNAMVLAAKREALLQEARQDLERAVRGGGVGRYTDHAFGSYRLGNLLGRGGMGEVYEARHVDTDEAAAVKLLPLRELANPRSVERFAREIRVVSTLQSPYVVRVLAASAEQDPIPFFVMERLHGHDLGQVLRTGRLSKEQLLELLAQVGEGLSEAWERGIVHRDLKPHNVYRDERSGGTTWKVLDFGVAAFADHAGTLTHGNVVGTPAYMAPEQAKGDRVDHRADLYALSAIAYRCLTGRPVCSGDDLQASLYQVVHAMPIRPSAIADLDPDVDAVLAIGLAKNAKDRWASAAELREALADAVVGRLDAGLRDRAAVLLSRMPWGSGR